jgi:hypothetical protein
MLLKGVSPNKEHLVCAQAWATPSNCGESLRAGPTKPVPEKAGWPWRETRGMVIMGRIGLSAAKPVRGGWERGGQGDRGASKDRGDPT